MDDYLPASVPNCIRNSYEVWCILVVRKDTTKELAKQILRKVPNKVIHCFAEVAKNLLLGNVKVCHSDIQALRKYRRLLITLANQKEKIENKRAKLIKYADQLRFVFAPIAKLIDDECQQYKNSTASRSA